MSRTRGERRAQTDRVIKKRLAIIRNAWGYDGSRSWNQEGSFPWAFQAPHRFAKYNLCCSCAQCRKGRASRKKSQPPEE